MAPLLLALALQDVESLIRRLGDESPDAREKAYADLAARGASIDPELRKFADHEDDEIRMRVRALIDTIETNALAESLIADGLSRKWAEANPSLIAALHRGEFERLFRETRGVVDDWSSVAPTAPLRGHDAGVVLNYIVGRLEGGPHDTDEFHEMALLLDKASDSIGNEGGGATGEYVANLDILRFELLMSKARKRALKLLGDGYAWAASPQLYARLLRSREFWPLADSTFKRCLRTGSAPELLPELLEMSRERRYVGLAAELMGHWRTDPARSIPRLRELCDDPEGVAREPALRSLIQLRDPEAEVRLRNFLKQEDSRETALVEAGRLGLDDLAGEVMKSLDVEDDDERAAACFAAGRLGIAGAKDRILEIFRIDKAGGCVRASLDALFLCGEDDIDFEEILGAKARLGSSRFRLHDDVPETAIIRAGRRPPLDRFLELLSSEQANDLAEIIEWYPLEATAAERDRLDRDLVSKTYPESGWVWSAYAYGDPERLKRLMPSLLESESIEDARDALYYADEVGFEVPRDTVAEFLESSNWLLRGSAWRYALAHGQPAPPSVILELPDRGGTPGVAPRTPSRRGGSSRPSG